MSASSCRRTGALGLPGRAIGSRVSRRRGRRPAGRRWSAFAAIGRWVVSLPPPTETRPLRPTSTTCSRAALCVSSSPTGSTRSPANVLRTASRRRSSAGRTPSRPRSKTSNDPAPDDEHVEGARPQLLEGARAVVHQTVAWSTRWSRSTALRGSSGKAGTKTMRLISSAARGGGGLPTAAIEVVAVVASNPSARSRAMSATGSSGNTGKTQCVRSRAAEPGWESSGGRLAASSSPSSARSESRLASNERRR